MSGAGSPSLTYKGSAARIASMLRLADVVFSGNEQDHGAVCAVNV